MTKMAAMLIYGKNPLNIFTETSGPISLKFGMHHMGQGHIITYSNNDTGLTLTYFTEGQIL